MELGSNITISELMAHYPSAAGVFIRRRMSCIGCPADRFHTIEEAAGLNGISLKYLMKDLKSAIRGRKRP